MLGITPMEGKESGMISSVVPRFSERQALVMRVVWMGGALPPCPSFLPQLIFSLLGGATGGYDQ